MILLEQPVVVGEQAVAHVCRLLDIVSCTTMFLKLWDGANKHKSSKQGRPATPPSPPTPAAARGHVSGSDDEGALPISEVLDMAATLLVEFYYYSFAHLTPPVHCNVPH